MKTSQETYFNPKYPVLSQLVSAISDVRKPEHRTGASERRVLVEIKAITMNADL